VEVPDAANRIGINRDDHLDRFPPSMRPAGWQFHVSYAESSWPVKSLKIMNKILVIGRSPVVARQIPPITLARNFPGGGILC
jgi:hypothetical protein